jgi:chromosome partitioning protein
MNIIAIANQKGGCGKTTTSINLAACLGKTGHRTLLIDADPQGHASLGLGHRRQEEPGLYEVFALDFPIDQAIIQDVNEGVDLIPATISLAAVEHVLADMPKRERQLNDHLESIQSRYEYVIIDCPPALGLLSINAIRAADRVLVPIDMSLFSIDGIERLSETIDLVAQKYNLDIEINILPTIVDKRTRLCRKFLLAIWERYQDNVLPMVVHSTVRLKEAACEGQSILQFDPRSIAAKDYQELAEEIIRRNSKALLMADEELSWLMNRIEDVKGIPDLTHEMIPAEDDDDLIDNILAVDGEDGNLQRVELVYTDFVGRDLKIAGEFNNWAPDEGVTTIVEDDAIRKIFYVEPGEYQYRLIIDGKWRNDPTNPDQILNSLGVHTSMLKVNNAYQ